MEIFKDVKGYEGFYQVSNRGRVKSFVKWRGSSEPRILSAPLNSDGYPLLHLCRNGNKKSIKVHQLVAMAFLGYTQNGNTVVVDHINHDKTDNNVKNLQVISHRENSCKRLKKYTSKYVGVSWRKDRNKWTARINLNGVYKHLGNFTDEKQAYFEYQKALNENNVSIL